MDKTLLIIVLVILMFGCSTKHKNSEIEVIKYSINLVTEIQSNFDSTFTKSLKRADFWTIDYFLTDTTENRIMKDSLGNIVAILQIKNGINIFVEEYFSNGQLRVKHNFPPGKIEGPVKSYYQNGQIKSTGQWVANKQVGEWKEYKQNGQLKSIKFYNNGKIEREEITNHP